MSVAEKISLRPIFCVIETACRDRKLAEEICAGRFTHLGLTLNLGVEPNWLHAALPTDQEWRIDWSKFYYGLDLAYSFNETGDPKFLKTWERLVLSWIRQVPIGFDRSDVAAQRIQNWIYAWNEFVKSSQFKEFSDGTTDQIFAHLAAQINHLRQHLTPERNHRTLELYAIFIVALSLPEIDPRGSLLDFALAELHVNLLTDFHPDGVHRGSSTYYHMIALRAYLGTLENARRYDVNLPDGFKEHVERACEFALHCHRPDGLIPAFSDSDTGSYSEMLRLAAVLLSRPDFLYAATGGKQGSPPEKRYASFPLGGYYMQRSGWGAADTPLRQENFLMFDCGPLGDGGHGHYDLLSIEVAAAGAPLIVDPGRYTYSDEPPDWRRWFKCTAAHNTVCVDDLDQTPYRPGKPKGQAARGELLERVSAPGFDSICGVAISPAYEAVHTRRIAFIGDEYWIIADHLRSRRAHKYDLRFHLTPEAHDQVETDRMVFSDEKNYIGGENSVVRAPGMRMVFAPTRDAQIEPGWVAPLYGIKSSAPVISVKAENATDADFYTLLYPLSTGDKVPTLRVAQQAKGLTSQSIILEINGVGPDGNSRDLVGWRSSVDKGKHGQHDNCQKTIEPVDFLDFGKVRCRAAAGWMRESKTEKMISLIACDVFEIVADSQAQIASRRFEKRVDWISWDLSGGLIQGCQEEL